jgi:hypothetical protein
MEVLITIIIIGAAIFFFPYVLAAGMALIAIFVALIAGLVAVVKSFGRK